MYILVLHHNSMKEIEFNGFDSSPLPWHSASSRLCPIDIHGICPFVAYANTQNQWQCSNPSWPSTQPCEPPIGISTPDPASVHQKAPAGAEEECNGRDCSCPVTEQATYQLPYRNDHSFCWQDAGRIVWTKLIDLLDSPTSQQLEQSSFLGDSQLSLSSLKRLNLSGWAISNMMGLFRMLGIRNFPVLEEFSLNGCFLVSPSLTDHKNAEPRPMLERAKSECCPMSQLEFFYTLMHILSFRFSPFAREYSSHDHELYWMSLFNGGFWTSDGFPRLKRLRIKVGNFDDANRWITPAIENCFSLCPNLEEIELDHMIMAPLRSDDALIKLFTMLQPSRIPGVKHVERFPALKVIKIKLIEYPSELLRLQSIISRMLGRPVAVQARKLFLRVSSSHFYQELELLRTWESVQHKIFATWLRSPSADFKATERQNVEHLANSNIGLFSDPENSALITLTFDSNDENQADNADPVPPIFIGTKFSKLHIRHFTPSNLKHQTLMASLRFFPAQKSPTLPSNASSTSNICEMSRSWSEDLMFADRSLSACETTSSETEENDFSPEPLRRVTFHLDLPRLWQVPEDEAKNLVTKEVGTLRTLIKNHRELKRSAEIRLNSCTRITYGGSNWAWWQTLVCDATNKFE